MGHTRLEIKFIQGTFAHYESQKLHALPNVIETAHTIE